MEYESLGVTLKSVSPEECASVTVNEKKEEESAIKM